jgi:hypothetical protein
MYNRYSHGLKKLEKVYLSYNEQNMKGVYLLMYRGNPSYPGWIFILGKYIVRGEVKIPDDLVHH